MLDFSSGRQLIYWQVSMFLPRLFKKSYLFFTTVIFHLNIFLFYIELYLINNILLVSGVQQALSFSCMGLILVSQRLKGKCIPLYIDADKYYLIPLIQDT